MRLVRGRRELASRRDAHAMPHELLRRVGGTGERPCIGEGISVADPAKSFIRKSLCLHLVVARQAAAEEEFVEEVRGGLGLVVDDRGRRGGLEAGLGRGLAAGEGDDVRARGYLELQGDILPNRRSTRSGQYQTMRAANLSAPIGLGGR